MHAYTLMALESGLKTAKNILDIGTGSGFITAAMAAMASTDAKVYAVDHIAEINDFAKHNIGLACPNMSKKGQFTFVTKDGRKGLREFSGKNMQYDVIHVGGQLEESVDKPSEFVVVNSEIPGDNHGRSLKLDRTLMEQLAPGGKMWVPLTSTSSVDRSGNQTHHEVYVITRAQVEQKSQIDPKIEDLRDDIKELLEDGITEQDILECFEENETIVEIPDWERHMKQLIKECIAPPKIKPMIDVYTYKKIMNARYAGLQDVNQ